MMPNSAQREDPDSGSFPPLTRVPIDAPHAPLAGSGRAPSPRSESRLGLRRVRAVDGVINLDVARGLDLPAPRIPGDSGPGARREVSASHVEVLGMAVNVLSLDRALARVTAIVEQDQVGAVVFANANLLNLAATQPRLREAVVDAALVLNDGIGVSWAANKTLAATQADVVDGDVFPDNLNGTDFVPLLLQQAADRGWGVAILGARPGVADRAADVLRAQFEGLQISYVQHGYFAREQTTSVVADIRASEAEVLLVGLGNPQQELWLQQHLASTGANLGLGVGAFLDFAAGDVRRAPMWVRTVHAEWLFRLLREPRRLFARYVIGGATFWWRVQRHCASLKRESLATDAREGLQA
jgi:exopolysaccharide biosynthesis WecB/TagA/CpsF family protein